MGDVVLIVRTAPGGDGGASEQYEQLLLLFIE